MPRVNSAVGPKLAPTFLFTEPKLAPTFLLTEPKLALELAHVFLGFSAVSIHSMYSLCSS